MNETSGSFWRRDASDVGESRAVDDRPFCMGGPPVTLLDGVRRVMQPGGGLDTPRSMNAVEVFEELRERWPDKWALCTVLDVANALRGFYG